MRVLITTCHQLCACAPAASSDPGLYANALVIAENEILLRLLETETMAAIDRAKNGRRALPALTGQEAHEVTGREVKDVTARETGEMIDRDVKAMPDQAADDDNRRDDPDNSTFIASAIPDLERLADYYGIASDCILAKRNHRKGPHVINELKNRASLGAVVRAGNDRAAYNRMTHSRAR
jgi:hypothetical protein